MRAGGCVLDRCQGDSGLSSFFLARHTSSVLPLPSSLPLTLLSVRHFHPHMSSSSDPTMWGPGYVLKGRWTLEKQIAYGSYSTVWYGLLLPYFTPIPQIYLPFLLFYGSNHTDTP